MGFLAEQNLADVEVPESDWFIANGTYLASITNSELMHPESRPDATLWQITYRIDPEVETYGNKFVSEFFDLDPNLPDSRKVWLKRRLQSLEISDQEAADMDPGDIIGTEVTVTVKNKPSKDGDRVYTNVTKVTVGSGTVAAASYMGNF